MSCRLPPTRAQRGFALLETVLAVMVVAIALAALVHGMSVLIQTQTVLRDQAQALQVGWQQWQALRQGMVLEDRLTVTQAGRDWQVITRRQASDFPGVAQLVIEVSAADAAGGRARLAGLQVSP